MKIFFFKLNYINFFKMIKSFFIKYSIARTNFFVITRYLDYTNIYIFIFDKKINIYLELKFIKFYNKCI